MSAPSTPADPERPEKQLVCLGEGLVDLIGPDPSSGLAGELQVHFGGAVANVAVAARRAGAAVALASGCGRDCWGRFLVERLRAEGIDLRFYAELEGVPTAFAFAFLDPDGEPAFEIHGSGIDAAIASLAGREREIADAAAAVVFGSNTLVDAASHGVTEVIVEACVATGTPLMFDPNLRPGRWNDLDRARTACLPFATRSAVVKCNASEACWLLGRELPPAEAAEALVDLGPRLAVVTDGPGSVVCRGATVAEADPPRVEPVSPLGAGDAFMGSLAAGLLALDLDLSRAGEILGDAAAAGARACTHHGAVAT